MRPHQFWQEFGTSDQPDSVGPFVDHYPVYLPHGHRLELPIRVLPDGQQALASLIINQASFAVQEALADALAKRLSPLQPEIVVGLPTLGLTLAAAVATRLGHTRYVPLGTSRKFWYRDELSVPLSSITTPDSKQLYLDPRLLPLLADRRVALVDDVISTGKSITAGIELLTRCEAEPVVVGAAMLQSTRWLERACPALPDWTTRVVGVFETPLLVQSGAGWIPAS